MTGSDEPKPSAPTGWITLTEVSDAPGLAAIHGVALLCLAVLGVLAAVAL